MATLTGLINIPAPIIGAYVWGALGPDTLLTLGGAIGFTVIPLILLFIKEPETRQR